MKAFTDINQSRKLAEILPINSADMTWCNSSIKGINYIDPWHAELKTPIEIESIFNKVVFDWKTWWSIIPCWSLAALLNYLREIDFFPEIDADKFAVTMSITYFYHDVEDERRLVPLDSINVKEESFIDACVEMILKLHEEKLL